MKKPDLVYGIKYEKYYCNVKSNVDDLKLYINNQKNPVVKLKVIYCDNGNFNLFISYECVIIDDNSVIFKEKIKDKTGKTYKIRLEEI